MKNTLKKITATLSMGILLLMTACNDTPPIIKNAFILPVPVSLTQDTTYFALPKKTKIGINDPRTFTNVAGKVFSAYRPQVGDKILISAAGIEGTADDYAVVATGENKLQYASAAVEGLSYKVLNSSDYISIGGATNIGSKRVEAILLDCVAI